MALGLTVSLALKEALNMGILSGWKTYVVAALMVILSGLHAQGYIGDSLFGTLSTLLTGLGLGFLRAGVKTDTK